MNIEDIKNVILEAYAEVREEKETADSPDTHKITDLPKSLQINHCKIRISEMA